ncbi:MAG: thiamine-phosphate kinase [Magnetospirillum sp. WYHS-4]
MEQTPKSRRTAGEFDLIAQVFAPLAAGEPGALGLLDDAALLDLPSGRRLVVTTDTMVEGVHFAAGTAPEDVAAKLLRVNLSDLAAMGAEPRAYTLNTAWPADLDEAWIRRFGAGLAADQKRYSIRLLGGDTVRTPGPLVLTVTALGLVGRGEELRRSGARPGDDVWVSGTIGDGFLGLMAAEGRLSFLDAAMARRLVDRLERPTPRLALGRLLAVQGLATAAADVSDGLLADLGHICRSSEVAAEVDRERLPLSAPAQAVLELRPDLRTALATGGDDYELVFAARPEAAEGIAAAGTELDLLLTRIGTIREGTGVRLLDAEGCDITPDKPGFRHF